MIKILDKWCDYMNKSSIDKEEEIKRLYTIRANNYHRPIGAELLQRINRVNLDNTYLKEQSYQNN